MSSVSHREFAAQVRLLPWVGCLGQTQACSGTTAANSAASRDKYPCRSPARWRFTALAESKATDGVYCWSHLLSQCLFADLNETLRMEDWVEQERLGA